jgi:hypothetical protein
MEAKWQDAWYDARINESEPRQGKPKFFMIFAYPGVTGYMHVGRWARMRPGTAPSASLARWREAIRPPSRL